MEKNVLLKKNHDRQKLFYKLLQERPFISAVLKKEDMERYLESTVKIVFLLFGDIRSIPAIVERCKKAEKLTLIHIDFIEGLSSRDIAADYIAENTRADGIISTKPNLVKRARALDLVAIQRFFAVDSHSLENLEKQLPLDYVDALEVMPGIMPKVIGRIIKMTSKPIIAGGLISDQEDVQHALEAGAMAVSSSKLNLIDVLPGL